MKLCPLLLSFMAAMLLSCATDPLVVHYQNWQSVTKALTQNKEELKLCKKTYDNKFNETYVIYTFNIIKDSAENISTFNDPYKLPNEFHECINKSLQSIRFTLKDSNEFRNGYLLINKTVEKFNYVIY